jgi:GcrA cell cycle regulator
VAWTKPNVLTLIKLWTEGLSASRIAARLGDGFTRNAVISKVHRLKLPLRDQATRNKRPSKARARERANDTATSIGPRETYVPIITEDDVPTKTFDDLEQFDGCCRWRCDVKFRGEPYGFCGREALAGLSVCLVHAPRQYANWPDIARRFVKAPEKEVETV